MSVVQFIFLGIVLVVWWRLYVRLKTGEINLRGFLEWFLLWLAIGFVVLVPDTASYLAAAVGVGRGSDLVVYATLLLVLYVLFRIFIRLERQERQLTTIVRELALREASQSAAEKSTSDTKPPPL